MGLILLLAYQMWGKPSRMFNIEDRRRADLQITLGLLETYLSTLGFDWNQGNAVTTTNNTNIASIMNVDLYYYVAFSIQQTSL